MSVMTNVRNDMEDTKEFFDRARKIAKDLDEQSLADTITQALGRKPMTEDELDRILDSLDVYINTHAGVVQFVRAIEAHHGIK